MNDTECVDDVERTVCDSLNEKGQSPWTSDGRDRFLAFSSIFENRAESGDSASFIHSKYWLNRYLGQESLGLNHRLVNNLSCVLSVWHGQLSLGSRLPMPAGCTAYYGLASELPMDIIPSPRATTVPLQQCSAADPTRLIPWADPVSINLATPWRWVAAAQTWSRSIYVVVQVIFIVEQDNSRAGLKRDWDAVRRLLLHPLMLLLPLCMTLWRSKVLLRISTTVPWVEESSHPHGSLALWMPKLISCTAEHSSSGEVFFRHFALPLS